MTVLFKLVCTFLFFIELITIILIFKGSSVGLLYLWSGVACLHILKNLIFKHEILDCIEHIHNMSGVEIKLDNKFYLGFILVDSLGWPVMFFYNLFELFMILFSQVL